ncbi:hypothetical protein ACH5RR_010065 [Cinchona calisaya]|uniref:Uncharacterized protein n=1 Tax=Cinchona calisaya TaxID=153742 RepID=A0ABD3AGQ5_9GENT
MGFLDSVEKDLHDMECNFLSRQIALPNKIDELSEKNQRVSEFLHDEKQDRSEDFLSSLKVKLPEEKEEEEEGCTTPTSVDHKIPQVCPPAPRKPKAVPSTNFKSSSRRRVLLDLSNEIESLFRPALLADIGKKIKKVGKESVII